MPLRVISAWEVPATPVAGTLVPAVALGDFERSPEQAVERAVAQAERLAPAVECSGSAVHGSAASSLVAAAGSDDLLVVGSRGRAGLAGLLLGSVGLQVVHDAGCPVVVVRRPRTRAA